MTNEQIAEELAVSSRRKNVSCVQLKLAIKKALDRKDVFYNVSERRDYFAAHAPIVHGEAVERGTTESDMIRWLAKLAYEYADAMMEERKKKHET